MPCMRSGRNNARDGEVLHRGTRHHGAETGRTTAPYWVTTTAEARTAVEENAARKVDIIKIWVDDRMGTVKKLSPSFTGRSWTRRTSVAFASSRTSIRSTMQRRRCAQVSTNCPRRARQGSRRRIHGAGQTASAVGIGTEYARPWSCRRYRVAAIQSWRRRVRRPAEEQYRLSRCADILGHTGAQPRKDERGWRHDRPRDDGQHPYAPHVEMLDMVKAGMTPMQVLVAATRNGAQFLRLTDTGTIEANKSADFLVLDANPLDYITNTRRIASVDSRSRRGLFLVSIAQGHSKRSLPKGL